jgi:FkbM family methyltransferase
MQAKNISNVVSICLNSGLSCRGTLSRLRDAWRLDKRGKKQEKTGYKFWGYDFECVDPEHFAFLFTEIFIAQPYQFTSPNKKPYIIDGGVNIGLSLAYFNRLNSKSRIVGFEPHPEAYAVAKRNIKNNNLDNVELVNAALSGKRGKIQLSYIPGEIMASTTGSRLDARGETPFTKEVDACLLSDYMNEEVDFLKLDIEGAENAVLREAESKLKNVRNIFLEFHQTRNDDTNSLSDTILLLERNGFDILITSTLSNLKDAVVAPLTRCGPVSSLLIFAKRID